MRFVLETPVKKEVEETRTVQVRQDSRDVNIILDGVLFAYFAYDGEFHVLLHNAEHLGIKVTYEGRELRV